MAAILLERRDRIAFITLNRPEAMNAFNLELRRGLYESLLRVRDDPDIWTAVITGAGDKAFSAGADLKEMSQRRTFEDSSGSAASTVDAYSIRDLQVWKPLIAAINGYCIAGGLEVALACDIRIAAEHASFGLAEVSRGIIPGWGGTQRLPRLAPFGVALEMLMTGDRISAQDAYRLGLVNKVVPLAELLPTAEALARRINENGPLAVRAVKEAAYRGVGMPLEQGLRLESLLSAAIQRTEDAREGPRAFAEKRKAVYKGR